MATHSECRSEWPTCSEYRSECPHVPNVDPNAHAPVPFQIRMIRMAVPIACIRMIRMPTRSECRSEGFEGINWWKIAGLGNCIGIGIRIFGFYLYLKLLRESVDEGDFEVLSFHAHIDPKDDGAEFEQGVE